MRFMILVTMSGEGARQYEAGRMPTQEEISLMMTYNQELADAGVMRGGDGLHPTQRAVRVEFTAEGPAVSDGPFAESKEVIGGYWTWNVDSRDEAIAWARKCPLQPGDALVLRQIFDMEDFGDAVGSAEQAQIDEVNQKIEALGA